MATILVVDDELGIRALLSEILTDEGHTVELAENAAQARHVRESLRPDLVLLDIWMPDVDGVTLLKEWSAGGHARSAVGRHFRNLYDGSDWHGGKAGWSLLDEHPDGAGVCSSGGGETVTSRAGTGFIGGESSRNLYLPGRADFSSQTQTPGRSACSCTLRS